VAIETFVLLSVLRIRVHPDGAVIVTALPPFTVSAATSTSPVATAAGVLSASELAPPAAAEEADPKAGVATLAWPGSLAVPQTVPAEQPPPAAFQVVFV
jgi:hypothetical protein